MDIYILFELVKQYAEAKFGKIEIINNDLKLSYYLIAYENDFQEIIYILKNLKVQNDLTQENIIFIFKCLDLCEKELEYLSKFSNSTIAYANNMQEILKQLCSIIEPNFIWHLLI